MQDKGEDFDAPVHLDGLTIVTNKGAWHHAKKLAISVARAFYEAGYHKQVYNRLLEAFQMQKSVVSATEVDNFFWLRDDDAADPTLHELARVMKAAMDQATPELLQPGEWHLPYIDVWRDKNGVRCYGIDDEAEIHVTLEEAIKVSCARCAAVSYRNEGYDLAKSIEVYNRLVEGQRKHASAFEHCATPMATGTIQDKPVNVPQYPDTWEPGVSHMDRDCKLWSGNFKGWIQYRKLIPGECYNVS
jgi:hypothetical protein